jgi:hypothetical protein
LSSDDQEEADLQLHLLRKREGRLRQRGLTEPVEYAAWKQVQEGLHTRKRWLRKNRRVAVGASPDAYLIPSNIGVISENDDHCSRHSLFSIEKTTPYTPTERTKACWDYSRLFLGHANRKTYLKKTYLKGDPDQQEPQWKTISDKGDLYFPYLGDKSARTHVNHTHIYGARADGGLTRYVIIDLDYHGRGRDVFLKMAEKLLKRFYGHRTWHLEVDLDDLQGIHFICTFEQPVRLDFAIQHLRDELSKLEKRNPDLVAEAHQLGKKSFAELELYPSTQQGIRLPLGRGRTLILDDYVKPIKRGKRQVGDVERYMRWIKDPNRKHKDRSEILDFLRICTPDETTKPKNPSTAAQNRSHDPQSDRPDNPKWRKQFRQIRNDYFLDGTKNGIPLNTHLLVMARCCVAYGKTDEQIRVGLLSLLHSLPDEAKAASRRLRDNDWSAINRQIDWVIKASHEYGHQNDSVKSAAKWKEVAARLYHLGEDPLEKTTWKTSATSNLSLFWTEKQRQAQYVLLAPVLCTTDSRVVFKFVDYVTKLVHRRQYRSLSIKYFKTCFTEHFPELSFTNNGKMSNLLAVLGTAGIVLRVRRGYSGLSSTYTLGRESLAAVSGSPTPSAATHEPVTTISFATLRRSWQGLRPRHIGKGNVSAHRRVSIPLIPANQNHRVGRYTSICSHPIMSADQRALIARGPPSDR